MTDRQAEFSLETFDALRREAEAALTKYAQFNEDCPNRLADAMRYSLLAPGKRIRPVLTLLASEIFGGNRADALAACAAVESVHAYSLIHDDLPAMDDDDLRRGQPTCHRKFDEATAILAGDALLTRAFEILARHIPDAEKSRRCILALSNAAGSEGMVGGQEDDVMLDDAGANDVPAWKTLSSDAAFDLLKRIHRRKTGALITASLQLGALVGEPSDEAMTALTKFGAELGREFQIADDLLDATGDEDAAGKRLHKDADAGKLTYVSCCGLERAKEFLDEAANGAKNALESLRRILPDAPQEPFDVLSYLTDRIAGRKQ